MSSAEVLVYPVWKRALFWLSWGLLFFAGYYLWHLLSMVGYLVFYGHRETLDMVLLVIMTTALVEVMLIAAHTVSCFWKSCCSFRSLMLWLLVGAALIPLAATLGAIYSVYTLTV